MLQVQSFTYQLALLSPKITACGFFEIGTDLIPIVSLLIINFSIRFMNLYISYTYLDDWNNSYVCPYFGSILF